MAQNTCIRCDYCHNSTVCPRCGCTQYLCDDRWDEETLDYDEEETDDDEEYTGN